MSKVFDLNLRSYDERRKFTFTSKRKGIKLLDMMGSNNLRARLSRQMNFVYEPEDERNGTPIFAIFYYNKPLSVMTRKYEVICIDNLTRYKVQAINDVSSIRLELIHGNLYFISWTDSIGKYHQEEHTLVHSTIFVDFIDNKVIA
jgi:hypothetical protein